MVQVDLKVPWEIIISAKLELENELGVLLLTDRPNWGYCATDQRRQFATVDITVIINDVNDPLIPDYDGLVLMIQRMQQLAQKLLP